jgi:hypothetical protein
MRKIVVFTNITLDGFTFVLIGENQQDERKYHKCFAIQSTT